MASIGLFHNLPNFTPGKGASGSQLADGAHIARTLLSKARTDLSVAVDRKGIKVLGGDGQSFKVPAGLFPNQAAEKILDVFA